MQNLSMGNVVRNNSFTVYRGQITGVFGLIGSGRTETAKIISGVYKRRFFHGGEILLDGRPVRYRVPRPAVRDGIVYVTEDRKIEGFFETMSIAENLYEGLLVGRPQPQRDRQHVGDARAGRHWTKALNIRAINSNARVIELSGGNQQKLVIAKSLVQKPKLIIFDEPTRGVDVGAIAEIHQLINRLADEGLAVLVISSYLPEVMNLSDRILVQRGRMVEEFGHRGQRGEDHARRRLLSAHAMDSTSASSAGPGTANGAPIDFYFDFISAYGYFASLRIEDLAARHGRTVQWHAMLLGVSVMKVMGLKPLLETPLKSDYVLHDAARYLRRRGCQPVRQVSDPMMDPRPAARAFYWVRSLTIRAARQRSRTPSTTATGASARTCRCHRRSPRWLCTLPRWISIPTRCAPVKPATRLASTCARRWPPASSGGCSARPSSWSTASRSGAATGSTCSTTGWPMLVW